MSTGQVVTMWIFAVLSILIVVWLLIKKADIKLVLFGVGLLLCVVAYFMGMTIIKDYAIPGLAPFQMIVNSFTAILPKSGLTILMLGGYTAFMSVIGANQATVYALTKPLKHIKSPYILVPIVFLIGNLLSLVIPSASSLSIILLATLYPVLVASGMSKLTAAAVIATTATVMPTPLGADNIAIAEELAKYTGFEGLTASTYVFKYHAVVSIPTLFVMAIVHPFWQKFCDSKDAKKALNASDNNKNADEENNTVSATNGNGKLCMAAAGSNNSSENITVDSSKAVSEIKGNMAYKIIWALLPVLPIIILLIIFIIQSTGIKVNMSVEIATIISFIFAFLCEIVRRGIEKNPIKLAVKETSEFGKGMAASFSTVLLLVAATMFVNGLKSIGLISFLQNAMTGNTTTGWVLPLVLVLLTALIVLLSGSGTALFYAMVPLMVTLAQAANINPIAVTIPMGLAGNLLRAVSPVSAVVCIVAGATHASPKDIVKRTSVPMIAGLVFMYALSMILYLR
ncbi:MAG: C4-dicarboxylate transporter DcuC [Bacilli bacterium]